MSFVGFGSRGGSGGGGTVTGATNIGAGEGVFAQDNAGVLEFKSLVSGNGINLTSTATEITVQTNGDAIVYPLSNVLFVNANTNPLLPEKGNIERPYPTYADALADFISGDVIMLTEDLSEQITLVPEMNIISLGVSVNSGAFDCITDAGVSCSNVRVYGNITLNPTTAGVCTLTGASGELYIENCKVNMPIGATVGFSTGNYKLIGNGDIINDSTSGTVFSQVSNSKWTGDIEGTGTGVPAFALFACFMFELTGNITTTNAGTPSLLFLNNFCKLIGNISSPLTTGGTTIIQTDNFTWYGDLTANHAQTIQVCDVVFWRGNATVPHSIVAGSCTFIDWEGKGYCTTSFVINTVFDSRFNVYIENYTPQYARAGGGVINSVRVYFNGEMLVNSSPFRGCTDLEVFGIIKYTSEQNLLDPNTLDPSAFFNVCFDSNFYGICELDDGNLPIQLSGGGNYFGGTYKYPLNSFINAFGKGFARTQGGGWNIESDDNIIDCTVLGGDTTNSNNQALIGTYDGLPHKILIARLDCATTNQTGTQQNLSAYDDILITARGGWYTNPQGNAQLIQYPNAYQPLETDNQGFARPVPNELESTGVIEGCELVVNGASFVDIRAGVVLIADNTDPTAKTRKRIIISNAGADSFQGVPFPNIATTPRTKIALSLTNTPDVGVTFADSAICDVNGVLTTVYVAQKETDWTAEQKRKYVPIGRAIHPDNVNIDFVVNLQAVGYSVYNTVQDFINLFPPQNVEGNDFSGVVGTTSVQKTEGKGFRLGSNYITDANNPNTQTMPSANPTTHAYRYRDGSGGFSQSGSSTFLDATVYDNGSGVPQAVPNNNWTVQLVYVFAGGGQMFITYGQSLFASKDSAIGALPTLNPVIDPNLTEDAIFRGYFIVEEGLTDTSNTAQFEWVEPLGSLGSGGGSPVVNTLQTAYDNSIDPEILTDDTRGAVTFKRGTTGGDTDIVQEILNGADEQVASLDGEGTFVGGTINASTGILTGGVLSVGAGGAGVATTYDISDGKGHVVTSIGKRIEVTWSGLTGLTPLFGANVITFVAIDINGTVIVSSTPFSRSDSRIYIVLGVIVHVNGVNVDTVNNEQEIAYNPLSSLYDAMESIGFFNVSGNVFSANGANLTINKSAGSLFKMGSNYDVAPTNNPHVRTNIATTGGVFQYRFNDGSSGSLTETNIDPDNLDNGSGGLTAVGNNQWSVQRIYIFTSNNIKIQRGVTDYATSDSAINGITTEPYITETSIAQNGLFRGWLVVKKGATVLNGVDAIFLEAGKFGESGGSVGSGSVTTLQDAFDNSSTPEIVTDVTRGAFTVRGGTGNDADNTIEVQNNAGTITARIEANGIAQFIAVVANSFNNVALTNIGSATEFLAGDGNYKSIATVSSTIATTATLTPASDTFNQANVTAQAGALTINSPSGTPVNGQVLVIRIKDNGTARALTWNASYRVIGVTLPTTTTISKTLYVGCKYNSQDAVWDVVAIKEEA